ncbi:flagellin [Rhizobium sp. Root149]|jgi:flagellin|uniref:Flagellin n=1 Tax=Rhizobium rhizoryzae TaxID=451876 RepID=A0A7W6LFL3_9HYPH|nr:MULTISPECIES: flagellin [Rhizobium]KQZ50782.1 flagellin [Rhizobium sp. Root149]MBB4143297.1 flagellin [Rhizobium rhizoryzae]
MTSILTNTAAIAALSTLRSIASDMETTQNHVSSGYRIETASDNAAYWSIATTMRSDNKALGTVKDALGLGAAMTDTAYTALQSSIKVVDEIKAKLTAASQPGVDKEKVQKEITQLQDQLKSIAKSASFSGQNWVLEDPTTTPETKAIIGSFNRDATGNISLTTLEYDTTKSTLVSLDATGANDTAGAGILSKEWTNLTYVDETGNTQTNGALADGVLGLTITNTTTRDEMAQYLVATDQALKEMTDAAADVGSINSRIDLQSNFVQDLIDSIDTGVGKLVDADMNEESTKLKALQTQQQLGIQALSIANNDSQNILTLFR